MKAAVVSLVCALAMFAGCVDDADPAGAPGDAEETDAEAMSPPKPEWQIGEYWKYDFGGSVVTFIVTEDAGSAWIVDVDDADSAFNHAYADEWATIGRMDKSDLAGEEGGAKVQMLKWPLEEGQAWTVQWDGRTLDARVTASDAEAARVELFDGDMLFRAYTYRSDLQWVTDYVEYLTDGSEAYSARVTDHGTGYTGEYVRYDLHDVIAFNQSFAQPTHIEFDVGADATDVWFQVHITCDPGGVEGEEGLGGYQIGPRGEASLTSDAPVCPIERVDTDVHPPAEGTWDLMLEPFGVSFEGAVVVRQEQVFEMGPA